MRNYDIQPWLDYFFMLRTYEKKGFLEVYTEKHEAYVTLSSLHAMSDGHDPQQQLQSGAVADTARRIRTYAAWRGQQGVTFLRAPFVLHVVKDQESHDLAYTMLLTRRRRWWKPWRLSEHTEVLTY